MDTAKEFQGKSLDEAIENACAYYGVERGKLEIDIVHDAKTGIFGLVGVRKACIRARKTSASAMLEEVLANEGKAGKEASATGKAKESGKKTVKPESQKPAKTTEAKASEGESLDDSVAGANVAGPADTKAEGSKPSGQGRGRAPRAEQAPNKGQSKAPASREETASESNQSQGKRQRPDSRHDSDSKQPQRQPRNGQPRQERGRGQAEARSEARPDQRENRGRNTQKSQTASLSDNAPVTDSMPVLDDEAAQFEQMPEFDLTSLDQGLVQAQILDVVTSLVTPIVENPTFEVNVQGKQVRVLVHCGEDSGILVGRDGQTLAAIQYIATRMVAKRLGGSVRLFIDTGNYRERQDTWLKELALSLAEKAKTSGRSHSTRPLSAYQRRIIHLALDGDTQVHTTSKGEGSLRRVIIMPARGRKGQQPNGEENTSAIPGDTPVTPEEHSAEE